MSARIAQCVVYNFQCNLCDAGYVGYTCRHPHQRIEEHKGSAIGNHLKEEHDIAPDDIAQFFKILKKCQSKFDCLIFEMFFIKELKPTLNKQCDSIRANYLFRSALITSIVFNCFRRIFCYLFLHIYIFYRILAFVTFFLFLLF